MMNLRTLLSIIVTVLVLSGCQSNLAYKRMQAKNPWAKNSPKSPTKMVDIWNTYAQTVPNGPPMRGIAGRVHFYNEDKKRRAIKVDGSMTVFVFDGDQKDPARAKPIKVFKFNPETLDKHYSFKKPLGHGYDFFMPFDAVDGEEKTLCVIARFDDTLEGTLVIAQPVNVLLKGSRSESPIQSMMAQTELLPDGIKQVSHMAPTKIPKPEGARNISTISLNDHLTRRLAQAPPQVWTPPTALPKPIEQASWTNEPKSLEQSPKSDFPDFPEFPEIEYPKF